ncbi:MAG: hypothetical protein ACOC6C_02205, partial [Verrucomicrobiota bacterium]
LIQEALKRQQEDNGQDSQEFEKAPPAQNPDEQTLPSESQENHALEENPHTGEEPEESAAAKKAPPQKKRNKNRLVPAGIIAVLVIVSAAAAVYFLLFAHGGDSGTKQSETGIPETAVTPEDQTADAPSTRDETIKAEEQTGEPENQKPEKNAMTSTGKTNTAKKIDKQIRKPAPSTDKGEKKPRTEPVLWPKLTVQGLLSRGREGTALINNELIRQDEQIKGVELIEVRKSSVVLKYKGETMELKARESTR